MRPFADLTPVFDRLLRMTVGRVVVRGRETLESILRAERRVVFALNHGPPQLPLVPVAALHRTVLECGGHHLRAVGIVFRAFYLVPGLGPFVRHLTQLDGSPSFGELLDGFTSDVWDTVVVMPEGANCAFGDPDAIQPFASPRFVELAARVDAPIVLVAHRGLERHAREVAMPRSIRESEWIARLPYGLGQALARSGKMTVPTSVARVPELRMAVDVHRPSMASEALASMTPAARRAWVEREASVVHAKLVTLHDALRADEAPAGTASDAVAQPAD